MKLVVRFGPYALVVGIVVFLLSSRRVVMGDSITVVRGVQILRRSLAEWKIPPGPAVIAPLESLALGPDRKVAVPGHGIGHFPLYQYAVGLVFSFLGADEETNLDLFCVLNSLALAGCIVLILGVLRGRSPTAAAAAVLVLLTGPLLWYARCSFGEMLAAFLILAYTAASLRGSDPLTIAGLFVAAGLTKETALPFLLLIAAVPLLEAYRSGRRWPRGRVKAVAWAALLTVALTAGFNYYRFGTPYNAFYLQKRWPVPDGRNQALFFAAIWLSPNGGLLFFWPSFVAALMGLTVVLLRTPRASRPSLVPFVGVGLLLLGLTFGFSKWNAPFGWPAWGPRLMLPWIPAAVLLLFSYYADQLQAALAGLCARPTRWRLAVAALAAASLPQAVSLVKPGIFWNVFRFPPELVAAALGDPLGSYFRWKARGFWPTPGNAVLLDCYSAAVRELPAFLMALVFALAIVGFALQVRAAVRRRQAAGTAEGDDPTKPLAA